MSQDYVRLAGIYFVLDLSRTAAQIRSSVKKSIDVFLNRPKMFRAKFWNCLRFLRRTSWRGVHYKRHLDCASLSIASIIVGSLQYNIKHLEACCDLALYKWSQTELWWWCWDTHETTGSTIMHKNFVLIWMPAATPRMLERDGISFMMTKELKKKTLKSK